MQNYPLWYYDSVSKGGILVKKLVLSIIVLLLLAAGWIALDLFVIGDPVDGDTLVIDVEEAENQLNVHIATPASAMAFSDISFRHEGTALHINVRKVLVSSLHCSGTKTIYVEKGDETEVWLGGRLIWSAE